MEDFIQFLVIAAGILFIGIRQRIKQQVPTSDDAFPPITENDEGEELEREYVPQQAEMHTSPAKTENVTYSSQSYTPVAVSKQQEPMQEVIPEQLDRRIDLRSPKKAREAFICSEIFNRKYK